MKKGKGSYPKGKTSMRSTTGMAKKRLMALAAVLLFVTAAVVVSFQTIDGIRTGNGFINFRGG